MMITIPPRSMTIIDGEFQHLKSIREISLNKDVVAFLEDAHLSLKSKGICNPRGPFARSLVHYAAMGDCAELLLYLLQWKQGAAKEDRDQNKRTPLSWAAEYGALRVVKTLLDNGAKVNSMDDKYLHHCHG
jgi:ankyrin repeat protein